MTHQINIIFHVTAGVIALVLGTILIVRPKGDRFHRKWGMYYLWLLVIVVGSGFLGWLFFRSNHFLLMLTVLAGYNTWSGFNVVRRKERRAGKFELLIGAIALTIGVSYTVWLMTSDTVWAPSVIYSTVSTLALVTVYDLLKGIFFHEGLKRGWLYEHIYKMISSFSALLSAFVGTVLPAFKPWSQIGPSGLCMMIVVYFIIKEVVRRRSSHQKLSVKY